jgi:hypothetical protein
MSRTYRRRRQRYEYSRVLRDRKAAVPSGTTVLLDPRSTEGRRAIARFHSDKEVTIGGAAPRWYRKVFDRRRRTFNDKQLRRWLADPGYDPVIHVRHRHTANWSWW